MRRDSCEVRQLLASHRWLFRHQPILHVCGNAELSSFSDGFGSLQSGRQLFGLGQSLGGPASPIVAIEIVSLDFCHVIVLTRRTRVAVLPPNSIAHHRAGVRGKSALSAPQSPVFEPGTCRGIMLDLHGRLHLGQRGHTARRGNNAGFFGSGIDALVESAGALPNAPLPMNAGTVR